MTRLNARAFKECLLRLKLFKCRRESERAREREREREHGDNGSRRWSLRPPILRIEAPDRTESAKIYRVQGHYKRCVL